MKKSLKLCLFLIAFLCLFFPKISNAAEKIKTCHYEENLIGAYLYFWDDGTVTGEQYYDGHQLDQSRKIEEYMDDTDSVLAKFNETDACPKYIVSYRSLSGFGVVRYKFFYEEKEKNAFVDDYDKCLGPICWTKSYWAGLTSSSGPNDNPEDNVMEGEEVFKKTFTSSSPTNTYGDAIFSFKYNEQNGNYRQSVVDFSDSEVNPILIDKSVDHFRTSILEPSMENKFPENLYCGTITSYLTLTRDYAVIVGGEVTNGSVVCSFDRTLFNDGTNKLIRFINPDYSQNGENDDGNESQDDQQGFQPGDICEGDECDVNLNNFCGEPTVARTFKFLGLGLFILKILVPAIIIIMGFVNLFKIITSGKEDEAKKYAKIIVRNVIIGLIIFIAPGLINFVFDLADDVVTPSNKSDFSNCVNCILDPMSDSCVVQD